MLKKRVIFTLFFDGGDFILSRNFRHQKVGGLNWLNENYKFANITNSIDEIVILNVGGNSATELFIEVLKKFSKNCFVPVSAGGGINSISYARRLLQSGADKLVINSILFENTSLIKEIFVEFGSQCMVASIDLKKTPNGEYVIYKKNGSEPIERDVSLEILRIASLPIGELYINSIERDGTGFGYDLDILNLVPKNLNKPIILAGGAGQAKHLLEGLKDGRVDAVATGHLHNFIGDGISEARKYLIANNVLLPNFLQE